MHDRAPEISVIVPTFNEAPNVAELVRRVTDALGTRDGEIIFVDDSTDSTPEVIAAVAAVSAIPVRLIHRENPVGGLSGAVIEGFAASASEWCVVMDGDLQHPPELITTLVDRSINSVADITVASRYIAGGGNDGLSDARRKAVSMGSTGLARVLFPNRLKDCTDPMTGFFAVRRSSLDVSLLRPRGFKILLEILATHPLRVVEEPFIFGERHAGTSKASMKQGVFFLRQLIDLRVGRMARFAVIGALGTVANLLIMAVLIAVGVDYLVAAIAAAGATILGNFFAQERFVFSDRLEKGRDFRWRFLTSVGANSLEAAVRLPFLALIVELTPIPSVVAQAITLAAAFVLRFFFHSTVVYGKQRTETSSVTPLPAPTLRPAKSLEDEQAA